MRRSMIFAVGVAALLAMLVTPFAFAAQPDQVLRPEVSMAVRHDVSPPLWRQARDFRPNKAAQPDREIPNRSPLDLAARHHPTPGGPDPLAQIEPIAATPTPSSSFDGISDDDNAAVLGGRVVPPDTQGDVGTTYYVQAINTLLAVYRKSDGVRVFGPVAIRSLWSGFGGKCQTDNDGDPVVLYDDAADRWMISQFAIGGDGHECIAISTTNDPTGSYYRYDFLVSPGRTNDYPKLGIWPDGYYMTANEFTSGFQGVLAVAFERDKMLLGQPAQMVKFGPLACGTECPFGIQPSHYDGGTAPPAGSPNTFIMSWDDETWGTGLLPDGYRLWDFSVSWTSPGASTFLPLVQVNAPEFDSEMCNFSRACIVQPAPGERLDPFAQVTMFRAQYRNFGTYEAIAISHTVDVSGRSQGGVRWAELRDTGAGWFLYQTGTIAPTNDNRWMSSIAMDKQGNIAVGYSVASKQVKPSVRYVTRSAGDPLGTMGSEVTLVAGAGVQQSSSNRWGDYSSMSLDPSDSCTFWYTQEYYANNGSFDFKTRIGSFKVPGCV